jgi:type I restriction enzyme, S subunit
VTDAWQRAGWRTVRLAEIADLLSGGTPSRKRPEFFSGDIPWLTGQDIPEERVADIEKGRESVGPEAIRNSATRVVPAGTVLITTRVSVGKTAVAARPLCFSQDVTGISVRVAGLLDPHFLAYYLLSQQTKFLQRNQGSTIAGITRDNLALEWVPLPLLSEQRRIVSCLQELDQIDALQRKSCTSLAKIVLAIFEDRFGNPIENPKGWPTVNLDEWLASKPKNGLYKPSGSYGSGCPIIRIGDFSGGGLRSVSDLQRVQLSDKEIAQYLVSDGDILVNRVNSIEYLGKSLLVSGLTEPTVFESNMMRLKVNSGRVLPQYAIQVLQNESVLELLRARAKRAVHQASINQGDLLDLSLPLPPLPLMETYQSEVRQMEALFVEASHASAALESLRRSLVAHAFSGSLTAAWRSSNKTELVTEAADRDAALRSAGGSVTGETPEPMSDRPRVQLNAPRPEGLTRDLQRVLYGLTSREVTQTDGGKWVREPGKSVTANDLASVLTGPLHNNIQAVEANLAVLIARGLVVALSREQRAPDTDETVFGNCYRLAVGNPGADQAEDAESPVDAAEVRDREILRLLGQGTGGV